MKDGIQTLAKFPKLQAVILAQDTLENNSQRSLLNIFTNSWAIVMEATIISYPGFPPLGRETLECLVLWILKYKSKPHMGKFLVCLFTY